MARYKFDEEFEKRFIAICLNSVSIGQAALKLGMNYKTVRSHAQRLGCFKKNQAGKGRCKVFTRETISLVEIFEGTPYQSHKLKRRLLKEGYKIHQCEKCLLKEWQGLPIPLELHHINGDRFNNALQNLRLLCPNCHALTSNYKARNIKNLSAPAEMREVEPLKFGES